MTDRPPEFDRRVLEFVPNLRGFATSLLRSRPSDVEDVVQRTVMRALEKWEQFEPGTNLKAWLFTILRHAVYDRARRGKREAEDPDGVWALSVATPPAQFSAIELREVLTRMRELEPFQRRALMMIADRFSYEEVAEVLGVAVGTVKSMVSRGREYQEGNEDPDPEVVEEAEEVPRVSVDAVVRLFKAGHSVSYICSELGADRAEVRNITMNVTTRVRRPASV